MEILQNMDLVKTILDLYWAQIGNRLSLSIPLCCVFCDNNVTFI